MKMDNMDQKKRDFIETWDFKHPSRVVIDNVLCGCETFEAVFGKDLSDFTTDEFVEFLNSFSIDKQSALTVYKGIIQEYVLYSGKDPAQIKAVMLSSLKPCLPNCFRNMDDFKTFDLKSYGVFPLRNDTYIMDRTFNFLKWYGFTDEEICEIEMSAFDPESRTIRAESGYEVTLDESTAKIVELCIGSTYMEMGVRYGSRNVPYEKSGKLIRRTLNGLIDQDDEMSNRSYYFVRRWRALSRGRNKLTNPTQKLDYNDISFSGAASRLYEETGDVDPKKISGELIIKHARISGSGELSERRLVSKFRTRYAMWRQAFH